ncbi:glycosyltransferase family 9 protein [Actinocorallia populi]|uniref:glycosyltransferase family 9 protein n=1 Tax=Actinocorallia populi TaxID=2079200 RepID=UPI000D096A80|nr:glycosyltransferase family 9 protein [Actinocorallia populi]
MSGGALVVRLDGAGDVLLAGPCVRAVHARYGRVAVLAGPQGEQAARLLPGVSQVLVWRCPWVVREPPPVRAREIGEVVERIAAASFAEALVLTSFHQSPLPVALLLRMAGVGRISAISTDYPGSLLDVRHRVAEDVHEAERGLSLARAAGFAPPPGDTGALAVRTPLPPTAALTGQGPYVAVHPGATAAARRWPRERWVDAVKELVRRGHRVVVTGAPDERELTAHVAGAHALDLGGRTGLHELAGVLARARVVLAANTGPAHLAAAVGTPIVSLFAPVVPAARWRPWRVPHVLLGDQRAACRASRAVDCPVPGHPCLNGVGAEEAADAAEALMEEAGR